MVREREDKAPLRIDLKAAVDGLHAGGPGELRFTLRAGETSATARPAELLSMLFGPEWAKPGLARIVREDVVFGTPAPHIAPQEP